MATEVKFKYPQPFSWAQVMDLDVGTISQGTATGEIERGPGSVKLIIQEITRLQHSLDHLRSTQDQLQRLVDTTSESTPDPDFIGAIQENVEVMCEAVSSTGRGLSLRGSLMNLSSNSQEERISILKHALIQKGVVSPSHYDLEPSRSTQSATVDPEPNPPSTTANGGDGLYI